MVDSLIYQGSRILCKHLFLPLGNKLLSFLRNIARHVSFLRKKKENFFVSQHVC